MVLRLLNSVDRYMMMSDIMSDVKIDILKQIRAIFNVF